MLLTVAWAGGMFTGDGEDLLRLGERHTNSLGMSFVRIEPGIFRMGSVQGDLDEEPTHLVEIRRSFYMGTHEVTNAQYERFDPSHRDLRGKLGFSREDDEAVVFVSWHDAVAFTEWLSEQEGLPYRLPTEAEWEYAARAGTTSAYHTGDHLPEIYHKNARKSWYPDKDRPHPDDVVSLKVGQTPPNDWGLFDVHGNVEEWTLDWYGPYEEGGRVDPVGRADGEFRVTRGGSHSSEIQYLRTANRAAALPDSRNWITGFRVAIGPPPSTAPLAPTPVTALHQRDVAQSVPIDIEQGPNPDAPFFRDPRRYIHLEPTERGPFFYHNHQADIAELPNGDLMAIWYTTKSETGRYLRQAAGRLRHGGDRWDPASVFWNVPDRNDHGNALWWDGEETVYHVSGVSVAATWGNLALILRTSTDSGATWSRARFINPEFGLRNQVISSMIRTRDGALVVAADAVSVGEGGTAIHVSRDGGETWEDPGGTIAGIHASVVELEDGRLMALGRGDNIDGRMPRSVSRDMGKTWTYSASPFPPIASTQRLVLLRLREGPLFLASFADNMTFRDERGRHYPGSGLFAALSYDEGETWPVRRLLTPGGANRKLVTARSREFLVGPFTAEPRGYLAGTQARDGVIHLISSIQHYAFNLKWLETPPAAVEELTLPSRDHLETRYGEDGPPTAAGRPGRIRFLSGGPREPEITRHVPHGVLELNAGETEGGRWVEVFKEGTAGLHAGRGVTAEIRARVLASASPNRGLDFKIHLGGEDGFSHHVSVTPDGIYAWDAFSLVPLALDLDNASSMRTYRLAVGGDGLLHVFRDGVRIALRSPAQFRDPAVEGSGPYLLWGGALGVRAEIEYLAHDLGGGYSP